MPGWNGEGALGARIRSGYDSRIGPEALRSALIAMSARPGGTCGGARVLNRFALKPV